MIADDAHVELHRGRIGMKLDHAHLAVVLVHVLVEGDQPRLVRLDKRTSSGTRCCSASNLPSLSRLVAMKMNGPGMGPPLVWVLRLAGPGSMVRLRSMTPAGGHCSH